MHVIFAGAGASKAVNPDEYPTTVEFLEGLPDVILEDKLFVQVTDFLGAKHKGSGPTDIEQVLWAVQEAERFLELAGSPATMAGFLLQHDRMAKVLGSQHKLNAIREIASPMLSVARTLKDEINRRVYDLYSRTPPNEEMKDNWVALLEPLLRGDEQVEIFTTNYDPVIEAAARTLETKDERLKVETGRVNAIHPYLNEEVWRKSAPFAQARLTKLHGSVDWSRNGARIFVGDPSFKGDHRRQVILYPGFKGIPALEPFRLFHDHFATTLASASKIVYIGFSFRDEYINSIIRNNDKSASKRVLVGRSASPPKGVPYSPEEADYVGGGFDADAVKSVLDLFQV